MAHLEGQSKGERNSAPRENGVWLKVFAAEEANSVLRYAEREVNSEMCWRRATNLSANSRIHLN
ncbi:hypothetical protein COW36_09340 [bacterium (Candidatus Blackallbacteria) CG17_big_fil_post_rev_8_21_14_2_50_48_46]|uniref:Uncharacterized protein n=1 Tax=bacterium (Candidatus Blackallbacteria) CG17_big_fil_post_rev_8_21_14_2_50_48_46 TaxID=2014261 RepID=A0A2M7G6T7_9BACT|nr:MAG: hypothetical protein COW64_23710 [bacterium (Candidatus Blackallbacteria) CG18_big_fil_WC_8_21_14_2_50_49_26]PIW17369.1 MAG: hypothetical protein COW36_09340 [bacterium (Candidatus Blackallbacteria) CG17_big_fil_post_rev_8_21_14_2_50_48_46]